MLKKTSRCVFENFVTIIAINVANIVTELEFNSEL